MVIQHLGNSDQGGRPDGVQVMVEAGHAFIGHLFSGGVTVLDVGQPRDIRPVAYVPCPPGLRSIHFQTHDGLMLVVNAVDPWAVRAEPSLDRIGVRIFNVSRPQAPREIGFCRLPAPGPHRIWWIGGPFAYVSAPAAGYDDLVLVVLDISDPAKPHICAEWGLPEMSMQAGPHLARPKADAGRCTTSSLPGSAPMAPGGTAGSPYTTWPILQRQDC